MLIFSLSATRYQRVVHDPASKDASPKGLFCLLPVMIDYAGKTVNGGVSFKRSSCDALPKNTTSQRTDTMNIANLIEFFTKTNKGYLGEKTLNWYHTYLRPLNDKFGQRELATITLTDLQELFLETDENISPFSRFNFVRSWKRLFRWAKQEGLIEVDPAEKLRKPPLPKRTPSGILDDDVDRLIKMAQQTKTPERDVALILFLLDTGARVGGAAELVIDNLNVEKRRAIVVEKGRGTKKERLVFFSNRTAQALRLWLDTRKSLITDHKRVFILREQGIYQLLKRLAERSRVTGKWNPHAFRHAFARRMLSKGMSIGIVSHLMGHSDVKVTIDFYGRFDGDELQQIYDQFN